MGLPKPKECRKIFYSKRIGDDDLENLLDFGITYSIRCRELGIEAEGIDKAFEKAIALMKKKGFCQGKIMKVISNKMNGVRLGVETHRIQRTYKP